MNKKIIWEKDSVGKSAIYKWKNRKKIAPIHSKTIATSKMKDVKYLSASLSNSTIMFYEWIWFLWDYKSYVDFFGIYKNEPSSKHEENSGSYICLRKSRWDKKTDAQLLNRGNDGIDYILSDLQLQSKNIFLDSRETSKIIELTQDIINNAKNGFTMKKIERKDMSCEYLEFQVLDDYMDIHFGYITCKNECKEFESMSTVWCQEFEALSLKTGLIPDNNLQVSYKLSLWDQIGRIGQES